MVQYALSGMQPGLQYLTTQLGHDSRELLAAFRTARLLDPQTVTGKLPTASDMDDLVSCQFVTSAVLSLFDYEMNYNNYMYRMECQHVTSANNN